MLSAVQTVSSTAATTQALQRFIVQQKLGVGARLPSERHLMDRLAVGRSTIREALKQLEGMGLVERRAGSGTYLRRPLDAETVHLQVSLSMRQTELLNGLEVRRALELQAVALAAERADAAQLAEIERHLLAQEAFYELHGHGASHHDALFHKAIYAATGNPLFIQLIQSLNEIFATFFTNPLQQPDFAERSYPFHRPLFEAIRDRDPAAARRHITAILDIVADDLRAAT